jgi:phage terminase large subunit GpA-like protein
MKVLDNLIHAKGFREGQAVKLGYNDIVEFTNQRVIEELDSLEEHIRECGKETVYEYIRERINELKQE